ncbi:E3 ubiquitin-protein ligase TRIM71-like isoform X2 [Symsagittifera roscoffensis]|uniref:E3 ubiquitin-protein ligase TRIM71-like isoform X2 n=1 Tax=Symsagittifera roscoffensis TaxID=84072 RepID=UPI00307C23F7
MVGERSQEGYPVQSLTSEKLAMLSRLNLFTSAQADCKNTTDASDAWALKRSISTPKLNVQQLGSLEFCSSSKQSTCGYCYDTVDQLKSCLSCSHIICDGCLNSTLICPVCGNESIDTSALYDIPADLSMIHHTSKRDGDTPRFVQLREKQTGIRISSPPSAQKLPTERITESSSSSSSNKATPNSNNSSNCTSCEEDVPAFAACEECNELMCMNCTSAHSRLKVTKDHNLSLVKHHAVGGSSNVQQALERRNSCPTKNNNNHNKNNNNNHHNLSNNNECVDDSGLVSANKSGEYSVDTSSVVVRSSECSLHCLPVTGICKECEQRGCDKCWEFGHRKHFIMRAAAVIEHVESARKKAADLMPLIEEMEGMTETVEKEVEEEAERRRQEVDTCYTALIHALQQKQDLSLHRIEEVKASCASSVHMKREVLKKMHSKCSTLLQHYSDCNVNYLYETDLPHFIKYCFKITSLNQEIMQCHDSEYQPFLLSPLKSAPAPLLQFQVAPNAMELLQSISVLNSTATCPEKCLAKGTGLSDSIVNKIATFVVQAVDYFGHRRGVGGDLIKCMVTPIENKFLSRKIHYNVIDNQNGSYSVQYCIDTEGSYKLHVVMNNFKIGQSPFIVKVIKGRSYTDLRGQTPKLIFGGEGSEDGQLCRPWGICCDSEGNIYVADRSNNRIQVFDQSGVFKFKFGKEGTRTGEFQRPASVAVDSKLKRLIVADKDNHRLQVFRLDGTFVSVIGEKGAGKGQFTYPWDVAVSSQSDILVSDTRNHRVQMFNSNGVFKYQYGLKNQCEDWQEHFDSPRGVCFTANDCALITDFNKHRVLVTEPDFNKANYFSQEGEGIDCLKRPQGICVDPQGLVLISDSRNHRVQVFTVQGSAIASIGGIQGTGVNEMDRPAGICVSPTGTVLVVDFGNNRILGF